ncbi:MAG: cellulose biosynthesis protein BcsE [Nevskiaceae bacterium]|nr:MAG: cellulose biosynthesis protein BcsE [Nevskiaceae bacterium]
MKPRQRVPRYGLGIAGLAASARDMLPGRLYAMVAPSARADGEDGSDGMLGIPLACLAATVAGALRGDGRVAAVLHSAPADFLARLGSHGIDAGRCLADGRLVVLRQTGDYAAHLAHHGAQRFLDELDYLGVRRHSLVVVERAERLFSAGDGREAVEQAQRYQHWFAEAGATGLLLFQPSPRGGAALRALDDCCAGLASFRAEGPRFLWQVRYWLSPLGSISQREYGLGFDTHGTPLIADGSEIESLQAHIQQAPDQDRVIATRAVVDGEQGVPAHWRIVDDLGGLLESAEGAIAATCVIDFHGGDQLRVLARAVHYLRRSCGRGLRIVVRERRLRLRYNDELLLLRLGANSVVYAEVGFSRFLSLVEALHGQAYSGSVPDDFESAVQAALPPPHSGYLTPIAFCEMVRECMAQSAHIGVESTLVCLYLTSETAHLDALRACRVKRPGDLFTADGRSVWLFLYACREPDADTTLDRVFGDALVQMFEGHTRFFAPIDILGAIDGLERSLYDAPAADYSAQLAEATDARATAPIATEPAPAHAAPTLALIRHPLDATPAHEIRASRQPLPLTSEHAR